MQKQNDDQSLKSGLNQRKPWKAGLGLAGLALLLSLALASAVTAYIVVSPLVPNVPNRAKGVTTRLGWYFQKGQMSADARTLAAVFRYSMEPERDAPTVTNFTNLPVAAKAVPSSPKS
jgi:hypothetical protein